MAMQIVETAVTSQIVNVTLSTSADESIASERVAIAVPRGVLKSPTARNQPFGEPEIQYLGEVQAAALLHARDAIDGEIRRLTKKPPH